ncbi:MAG: hypothetical protein BWZ03_00254 [bacterium ADurb.BinA186]|nr:MAG: hypothetical protein BWZ03_00254 [bacterium ADurb.BinA186]
MINEDSMTDLMSYRRIVLTASIFILFIIGASLCLCWYFKAFFLLKPLGGAFIGAFLASVNVLALGYAFFVIAIKKSSRKVLLWPVSTFLTMCGIALCLALNQQDYLLGFALGLTTPLIFGTIIALRA